MTSLRPGALLIACAAAAAAAVPASAQSPVYSRDEAGRVTIRASRVAAPIAVDGKLDDEAYTLVQPLTEFLQAEPRQGAAVSERTEAWVLYDDDNLYFSCRCWDEHPER